MKNKKWYSALIAGVVLLFTKLKYASIILKLSKFGLTFLTMILSIGTYALVYGWKYAVGFVLLLWIHENGHLLAAKIKGLRVSRPVFIPFVGALIVLKEQPRNAVTDAFVGLGGPLAGSLAALVCYGIYLVQGSSLMLSLTYTGFFLNLFNLIPVYPLDGGRIVTAITPKFWLVGIPILAYVTIRYANPVIGVFLIAGIIQAWRTYRAIDRSYYDVTSKERMMFALCYFLLAAFLGYMTIYLMHK